MHPLVPSCQGRRTLKRTADDKSAEQLLTGTDCRSSYVTLRYERTRILMLTKSTQIGNTSCRPGKRRTCE